MPSQPYGYSRRELGEHALDRRSADAVEAVTAGDHVAVESMCLAVVGVGDVWRVALELANGDVGHLEQQRQPVVDPSRDQILDHLGLPVDDDRPAAGELVERQVMPVARELQVDAAVHDPLSLQTLANAGADQRLDRSLLEHAGADPVLDVVAAAVLEHDRLDPRAVEQLRQREPRRAGTDDRDLRARAAQEAPSSASTSCATAKAWFAAGTPQ